MACCCLRGPFRRGAVSKGGGSVLEEEIQQRGPRGRGLGGARVLSVA